MGGTEGPFEDFVDCRITGEPTGTPAAAQTMRPRLVDGITTAAADVRVAWSGSEAEADGDTQ